MRFNTLLREAGIDPADVQLVRHQDTRAVVRTTPYSLWRDDRIEFERYQRLQSRDVFDDRGTIAAFVVPPNGETLFAGLYDIHGREMNAEPETCPVSGQCFAPGSMNIYDLRQRDSAINAKSGLLTIDWGPGLRSWVQRARQQDKPILELRKTREEPPFPSFSKFQARTDQLDTLPATWRAVLSSTGGVYLLVSTVNGEQYVGSASGEEGFLSRWSAYARDGHGGNVLLKSRGQPPYLVCVLETAASSASRTEIIGVEQEWKRRLGSRAFGLNAN